MASTLWCASFQMSPKVLPGVHCGRATTAYRAHMSVRFGSGTTVMQKAVSP
ncbi:hypothetical protein ABZS71_09365 [Streptomyces sp. NPDC005393]|uniref:hypothetical protein n=1 Tax=Streptomyces sp. NPDC005393 TaxID=3157041 RepID=UPI0033AC6A57